MGRLLDWWRCASTATSICSLTASSPPITRERVQQYVQSPLANGVDKLAFTERLFRFQAAYDRLYGS